MGLRTQATSITDMLCNRPCPSQGLTLLSTSQEGWLSWCYPTVFTEHPPARELRVCGEGRHQRIPVRAVGPGREQT